MKRTQRFITIKTKAIIYTITPLVIGFIIIFSFLFISLFNSQQDRVKAEFQNIVRKHARVFENKFSNVVDYLSFVSTVLEFQVKENTTDREKLQKLLLDIFEKHPDINGSSIYFEKDMYDGKDSEYIGTQFGTELSGRIAFYYQRTPYSNRNVSYYPEALENDIEFLLQYYLDVKEANAPVYTNPAMFEIEGEEIYMFIIAYPIRGKNNEFIGVITADIHLKEIHDQLQNEKIYESGYMIITNDKGRVIFHPSYEFIGKTREEAGLTRAIPSDALSEEIENLVKEARKNSSMHPIIEISETTSVRSVVNQKETLISRETIYFPRVGCHFYFTVAAPYSEINIQGTRLLILVIIISVIILAFMTFIPFFLIEKTMQPVVDFIKSAEKISHGDFSVRIKENYTDEFAALRDTINLMAARIESSMDESKKMLSILSNILDGIDALIYVSDPETCEVLFINKAMRKKHNLNDDDGIGLQCYKLFQNMDKRCAFCPCKQLDTEPDRLIVWEDNMNGRDIRHTDCYIDWPGRVKVHLQHAVDFTDINTITEEKLKAEREALDLLRKKNQAEETSRMKSVFLASMSHEIRTPMHGIIGFTELALDDIVPEKTKNYLQKIKTSSESLLMIINDILDVSKIEAGRMDLEKIPFNINDVFKLCRMIASPNAKEKGLTLFCYAEPSVGRMLLGDPTRLRQILLNLLSNAIKFTNNGMVKLLSAISKKTYNTVTMHFEVKDSGIGMTEEQLSRIFLPFIQADGSTTRKYGGTGLGLTITKSFIELMGGELEVESNYGIGSKFSFNLTFETIESPSDIPQTVQAISVNEKPVFDAEILVCEDNTLNQMVITDHLSKIGIKTVIAENGRIGLNYVNKRKENGKKPFDLIFMDIHMPEVDGLETAKKLILSGYKKPIIALTANIMTNDMETYIDAGMCDCLPKPFVAHDLWACLLKYLTPVSMLSIRNEGEFAEEEEQRMELITTFVKSNQNVISDIKKALQENDLKLAHRLAHTLKGVAGIVGMTSLVESAQIAEHSFSEGKLDKIEDQIKEIENELNIAFEKLIPIINDYKKLTRMEKPTEFLDKENSLKLLETLESLLKSDSFDSLNLVKELNKIKGAEELASQVENMKFKQARETLAEIRNSIASEQQPEKLDGE
ncbi:MAG: ATP-binding protein [Treponema sp.]|nr:ATP-binding protein [Treponema sp.]